MIEIAPDAELRIATWQIPARVAAMTAAERRAMVPALKRARAALPPRRSWEEPTKQLVRVQLWGLGCLPAAKAVAQWLMAGRTRNAETPAWMLIECLEAGDRDAVWRGELVALLAAGRMDRWRDELPYFPLMVHLIRTSGCPIPETNGFVATWAIDRMNDGRDRIPEDWARHQLPQAPNLLERLRADPFFPTLMKPYLEAEQTAVYEDDDRDPYTTWSYSLATLAAEGVIDRDALHDSALTALSRVDAAQFHTRFRLRVLTAIRATPAECAGRVDAYKRLAAEARSTVAGHAQEVLMELYRAELLPADEVVALSAEVLARPEKKLVRAQLGWLDRVLRDAPDCRPAAVPILSAAGETMQDTTIRQRIGKMIGHVADDATIAELANSTSPVDAEFPLPAPAPPGRLDLPNTPAETAELYRWYMTPHLRDVLQEERFFDSISRYTYQDRAGLTAALTALVDQDIQTATEQNGPRWWQRQWLRPWYDWSIITLAAVAIGVLRHHPHIADNPGITEQRMSEWGNLVLAGAPLPPFALATPTFDNGQIDALDLIDRMRRFEELDIRPGRAEFAQALLRVVPTTDPTVLTAADSLGSPEGARLATWLRTPEHTLQTLPEQVHPMLDSLWHYGGSCRCIELVPIPEILVEWHFRGDRRDLLRIVELRGRKGPAVHRMIADKLTSDSASDRTAAVDALVILVSREELRPDLLARSIQLPLTGKRLAGSLQDTLIALGAHRTWQLLEPMLPVLLTATKTNGLVDVLAIAAETARRTGASGDIPGLDAIIARGGSSRLVTEARALADVLETTEHRRSVPA
ncbi:hypothetical protein [Nocardia sp. NPDC052566]|uniref:hypothetical protein n=1 Tax=Nocardia sp. NPDC052566 TaxID=3364330 RepID=UPI0037C569C9